MLMVFTDWDRRGWREGDREREGERDREWQQKGETGCKTQMANFITT